MVAVDAVAGASVSFVRVVVVACASTAMEYATLVVEQMAAAGLPKAVGAAVVTARSAISEHLASSALPVAASQRLDRLSA